MCKCDSLIYCIAENLWWRNVSQKYDFRVENFCRLLACAAKGCHVPKFWESLGVQLCLCALSCLAFKTGLIARTHKHFCVYKHYCHSYIYVIFVEKTITTKLHITKVFCLESFCLAITTLKQATFEGEMFRENTILRRKLL